MAPLAGSTDWSPSFDDMSFGLRVDIFPSFFHLSSLLSWRYAPSSPSSPPYPYKVKECRTICGQGGGGKENEAKSDEGALYSAGEREKERRQRWNDSAEEEARTDRLGSTSCEGGRGRGNSPPLANTSGPMIPIVSDRLLLCPITGQNHPSSSSLPLRTYVTPRRRFAICVMCARPSSPYLSVVQLSNGGSSPDPPSTYYTARAGEVTLPPPPTPPSNVVVGT